jgi:hypothetical protein
LASPSRAPPLRRTGWSFTALTHAELSSRSVPEVERMRGYRVTKHEELQIRLTEPGKWSVIKNQLVREGQAAAPAP